jgi:multisubunit Na+/H+ antiporter MnhG subunit
MIDLLLVPAVEPDGFGALGVLSLSTVATVGTAARKHKTWQAAMSFMGMHVVVTYNYSALMDCKLILVYLFVWLPNGSSTHRWSGSKLDVDFFNILPRTCVRGVVLCVR